MAVQGSAGPLIVFGQNPAQAGTGYQPDYNGDNGPSAFANGTMLLDPRYGYRAPLQAGALAAIGFFQSSEHLVIDQVPATLGTAVLAALAASATTSIALVTVTGAGITVSTTALTMPASGVVLPVGTRFIDGAPAMISFGQNGAVAAFDPRTTLARCLSVTAAAGATATTCTNRGWDAAGFPVTETLTLSAGATVSGKKGFKALASSTLNAIDAGHSYSVGTLDVFEFPMACYLFSQIEITWNNGDISANTGFLAADATTPATATTGSVRGTYAVQTASDGTKRLQVTISPAPYNVGVANGVSSLFGVANFAG
jgi:hypothetical protein